MASEPTETERRQAEAAWQSEYPIDTDLHRIDQEAASDVKDGFMVVISAWLPFSRPTVEVPKGEAIGQGRVFFSACHRFFAAFFAIALRRAGVSAAARAFPPLAPPSLPSATAAGFFSGGSVLGACPVASSINRKAFWFTSLEPLAGFLGAFLGLLERAGMA